MQISVCNFIGISAFPLPPDNLSRPPVSEIESFTVCDCHHSGLFIMPNDDNIIVLVDHILAYFLSGHMFNLVSLKWSWNPQVVSVIFVQSCTFASLSVRNDLPFLFDQMNSDNNFVPSATASIHSHVGHLGTYLATSNEKHGACSLLIIVWIRAGRPFSFLTQPR